MEIYTIGFTQKTAREFFGLLKEAGIQRLVDVRRNNRSQLAGFTKQADLPYFLAELVGAEYVHEPLLAPSDTLLTEYRKGQVTWDEYERIFNQLLQERHIETALDPETFRVRSVLLCSEPTADNCHRRLVAEYLQHHWQDVSVVHL